MRQLGQKGAGLAASVARSVPARLRAWGRERRRWRPTEKPHERRAKPAADSGMSERVEGQVKHAMFMLCGGGRQYFIDSDAYNALTGSSPTMVYMGRNRPKESCQGGGY